MKQLTKEQEEQGIELLRKKMGLKGDYSFPGGGEVENVKISESQFFPNVPNYWKPTKVSIYNLLSKNADDYIRSYDFNGGWQQGIPLLQLGKKLRKLFKVFIFLG